MGAPLAPVIADIFMAHPETSLMADLERVGVCEWHRHVDDTFVLLQPNTNIDDVLAVLNGFHPSIQFTHEVEQDGSIAFLDEKVIRSTAEKKNESTGPIEHRGPVFHFDTTVYRKATFTGLMTNWHSFVPHSYKKASVVSMIQRALSICSTYTLLAEEFDQIRRTSQMSDYPSSFVDTCIGIGLTKYRKRKSSDKENLPMIGPTKRRMYVEIPFVGDKNEALKKQINRLTSNLRPDLDLRFVAKPPPSVRTYFPTKDPIPTHLKSDVVYSVKCADCGDTYVGKTERPCARRMHEHGAPKDAFDKHTNVEDEDNDDDKYSSMTNEQQSRRLKTRGRVNKVKDKQQAQEPPLRRSSRIRKKAEAVVNARTNPKTDRKIERTTEEEKKKTRPIPTSPPSLLRHCSTTSSVLVIESIGPTFESSGVITFFIDFSSRNHWSSKHTNQGSIEPPTPCLSSSIPKD